MSPPPPPQKKKKQPSRLLFLFLCLFCCCLVVVVPAWSLSLCWCIAFVFAMLATANFRRHLSVFRFSESEGKLFTLTTAVPHCKLQSRKMLFLKMDQHHRRTTRTVIAFQLKKRVTIGFWKKQTAQMNFIFFVSWVCLRQASLSVFGSFS